MVPLADPCFGPFFAVIVTDPAVTPVTAPVRETVAVARLDVDQVHWRVTSRTVPSTNVPVAVSWMAPHAATENGLGVTATLETFEFVTVSDVDPVTPDSLAVTCTRVALQATPVASPCEPAAFEIVAIAVLEEAHVTWVVTLRVEASE